MFLVAFAYVIGQIIPGVNTASDLTNWLEALPIIGGFLVTFIGLGWFSRNRKKKSKKKEFNADFLNSSSSKTADAKFAFNSSASFTSEKSRADAQTKSDFESAYYDAYALKKSKKLFRSITDKKVSGVCGGLAKYLGVSSTFLRLVFIIATFMGYGSPVLVYFILSFLLPKEPKLIIE
ncbi:PspC domain-containing protein [bacterium]|nr:MAG: PspC domain-containing protein [bacterium]